MATDDFFRARLDGMVDLRHPLAVLASRMPWSQIEAALAPAFAHKDRKGRTVEGADIGVLFWPALAGQSAGDVAGRPAGGRAASAGCGKPCCVSAAGWWLAGSCACRLCVKMNFASRTTSSQELEPPQNPGRFTSKPGAIQGRYSCNR